jgi:hypothetical protein
LSGAEEIVYEALVDWAAKNGWTVVNKIRPIALSNPYRKEMLRAGEKAIKNAGGVSTGSSDPGDSPEAAEYDIPAGVAEFADFFGGGLHCECVE